MKKTLLMSAALVAVLLLGGCTVISYEHYRRPGRAHVFYAPPCEVVEVIAVPGPGPRGHWRHRHPHP